MDDKKIRELVQQKTLLEQKESERYKRFSDLFEIRFSIGKPLVKKHWFKDYEYTCPKCYTKIEGIPIDSLGIPYYYRRYYFKCSNDNCGYEYVGIGSEL